MLANLGGWHLLIILAIVILIFGAAKLPALAKSVGQSVNIFKGEMKQSEAEKQADVAPTVVPEDVVVHTTTPVTPPKQ